MNVEKLEGPVANFLKYVETVLRGLVDDPEQLTVNIHETEKNFVITVYLPTSNVGQIIGKEGRIRSALQTIFWSASGAIVRKSKGSIIEFVETDKSDTI